MTAKHTAIKPVQPVQPVQPTPSFSVVSKDTATEEPAPLNPGSLAAHSIAAYVGFSDNAAAAKSAAKSAIKVAVEVFGAQGAAKVIREDLIGKHGLAKQRVSELLLEFGLRTRAAAKKTDELAAELAPVIEALIALANDQAGENAVSALRRAYLSAQGKAN
jgi:hypothetical protein